jgi:hypothetical protein
MQIRSKLYDYRIQSLNVLVEMKLGEYFELSDKILNNNQLQRRRVKSSNTVYSLLKRDLELGCVIPPIVLALTKNFTQSDHVDDDAILNLLNDNVDQLIILDGLQRTYTIRDLISEFKGNNLQLFTEQSEGIDPTERTIRLEIYIGLNKLGILYRMLTLNTGQTPMSIRHQIEIIYNDYFGGIENITFVREVDDFSPLGRNQYKFRDVIEGFTSYLQRDYLTTERSDLLDNISSLEKLSSEDQTNDLFKEFVLTYNYFADKLEYIAGGWDFENDTSIDVIAFQPFAKNVTELCRKSQVLTGFGAALGKLLDFHSITSINDLRSSIDNLRMENVSEAMDRMMEILETIRRDAKKIGNDQRFFFYLFFRELFDEKSDSHQVFEIALKDAYDNFRRQS